MSDEQQPHGLHRGPEFGGPGYDDEVQPVVEPTPPRPEPSPYQPPPAGPAPVVDRRAEPPAYGYGQQNYPVEPYGRHGYLDPYHAYLPQAPEHPSSGAVLALGIAGLFFPPLAVGAWVMGSRAKGEIQRGAPYRWGALGQVGYVLGLVYSLLMILGLVLMVLFFAAI